MHSISTARRPAARNRRGIRALGAAVATVAALTGAAALANADSVGPVTFAPPAFALGTINGQQGWQKTGPYDANVVNVAAYPAARRYGFGAQALQISDAVTSGSFGDQTFAPAITQPAGESTGVRHFAASFAIGSASATQQGTGVPGPDGTCPACAHVSVSPDNGQGARMSYLRFEDQPNGIHVFFDDVTDTGPLGTVATFNETDIATLSRRHSHTVTFQIDTRPGPANDVVRVSIDGRLRATGTSWEDYYRYDPEQSGSGNTVPDISTLLFRESGTADPSDLGKGFLIDDVQISSSRHGFPRTGYGGEHHVRREGHHARTRGHRD